MIPDRALALEWSSVVCDGALHGEATEGTNREGHGGLQREADSRSGTSNPQGEAWGNGGIEPNLTTSRCSYARWVLAQLATALDEPDGL